MRTDGVFDRMKRRFFDRDDDLVTVGVGIDDGGGNRMGWRGFTIYQLVKCDAEKLTEFHELSELRDGTVIFPFGNGLAGDLQLFRDIELGKSAFRAVEIDLFAEVFHERMSSLGDFLIKGYHENGKKATNLA